MLAASMTSREVVSGGKGWWCHRGEACREERAESCGGSRQEKTEYEGRVNENWKKKWSEKFNGVTRWWSVISHVWEWGLPVFPFCESCRVCFVERLNAPRKARKSAPWGLWRWMLKSPKAEHNLSGKTTAACLALPESCPVDLEGDRGYQNEFWQD